MVVLVELFLLCPSFSLGAIASISSGTTVQFASVATSVISIVSAVSVTSISSGTTRSDTSVVSVSSAGSTRMACEIPVFSVGSASFVISLCSTSSEISEFSPGIAASVAVSELSLCSYLGSSVPVLFVSSTDFMTSVVCVSFGASTACVATGSIFSVVSASVSGFETSVTCVVSLSPSASFMQ